MRVVLVSGGVISGVGKGEFLALLDVFPVVSLSRWAAICDDPTPKLIKPPSRLLGLIY